MQKIDDKFIENLKKNGCTGDLEKIEVSQFVKPKDLDICNCEFIGTNGFYGKAKLKNSTLKDTVFFGHDYICNSIVISSVIGAYTLIKNFSVVKNSTTSALTISQNENEGTFPVLINNAQVDGDVILGGTDLCKTKSRGGSIFAFAHIGSGEFIRSTILGTPPTNEVKNSLVEIGHFGYYGDLTVLSLATKDGSGKYIELDSDLFHQNLPQAFCNAYFDEKIDGGFEIERGRSNFGAGTTVSNYDPIKGTKAGAVFFLSSCGASVSISSYLTVLPGSLIATGSVDITRKCNIIAPNSLVIGVRAEGVILEGYFDNVQKKIMNDRARQEVEYLMRELKTKEALASFFALGMKSQNASEASAFEKALLDTVKAAKKLAEKTIPKYFALLEQSADALGQKISSNPEKAGKYSKKMADQNELLKESQSILSDASNISKYIEEISQSVEKPKIEDFKPEQKKISLTKGQEDQLGTSLINLDNL